MAATTIEEDPSGLPVARREALAAIREVVLANLPEGYEEGIQYGALGYYVPHTICPDGYHCDAKQPVPFFSMASKKSGMTLNFFGAYIHQASAALVAAAPDSALIAVPVDAVPNVIAIPMAADGPRAATPTPAATPPPATPAPT